jgi:hypothetical protein
MGSSRNIKELYKCCQMHMAIEEQNFETGIFKDVLFFCYYVFVPFLYSNHRFFIMRLKAQ